MCATLSITHEQNLINIEYEFFEMALWRVLVYIQVARLRKIY